ncbi:uncharacterized protein LOC115084374 isoform X2 [Rhinatrema bivittatum]|uniref:uncharacterized protein LOC115084374 isoform X2 n=1 Tax=Rhinatrema bivittatum TaxID=194408 RepID=UPI001126A186|nr:uncharacterized protein LOC115084374 isoform X2 [Rhinatrema bivittatum]
MYGASGPCRRGGVIRTYGRRQLYRRVQAQRWLSPQCQQHVFSTSSSASSSSFSSSCEALAYPDYRPSKKARGSAASSCEALADPDYRPSKKARGSGPSRPGRAGESPADGSRAGPRKKKAQGAMKLRARRKRSARADQGTEEEEEGKENDAPDPDRGGLPFLLPAPQDKFITNRRRFKARDSQTQTLKLTSSSQKDRPPPAERRLMPLKAHAVISKPPLLCSTPAQSSRAGALATKPSRRLVPFSQDLEESILHSFGTESVSGSWNMNSPTHSSSQNPPQLRAEQFLRQSCSLSNSKSVISIASSTAGHGNGSVFSCSAELFSQELNLEGKEGEISTEEKGTSSSAFQYCSGYVQRDAEVLFVNKQKGYLQPVVALENCVSISLAQSSGQEMSRLLECWKDKHKIAEINPKILKHLQQMNHFSTNTSVPASFGSARHGTKEQAGLPQNEGLIVGKGDQDSHCKKLDVCSAKRSHNRMGTLPQMTVNSVRMKPLLIDSQKATVSSPLLKQQHCKRTDSLLYTSTVSQKMVRSGQRALPSDCIGTGRKVCISGFSSKRWGKRTRTRPTNAAVKTVKEKEQNCSFKNNHKQGSLLEYGLKLRKRAEKRVIPDDDITESRDAQFSLLNSSSLNSSAFQNLSQDTSGLQYWTRLRATLSLHKKKKVEARVETCRLELTCTSTERSYLGAPITSYSQLSNITPLGKQLNRCQTLPRHSMSLLTPMKYSSLCEELLTDAEKVFEECQQTEAISFSECIPQNKMSKCEKIGEGVFGEVFKTISSGNHVALKIIPIEGSDTVNGETQKNFGEILPEIIISRELSLLCEESENSTDGFIKLHSVHCVKGSYPQYLLQAWDTYNKSRGSENDNPALFGNDQLFIILEFEFGGSDLENMRDELSSVNSAKSILHQVTVALAVAEEALRFEHRDLHWGNILVKRTTVKTLRYNLHGSTFEIPTQGVQANIIDYTLSRLEKDGLTVFCDIATDEALFQGQGDYQFDVYRSMRQENANNWSGYHPHSNVLWLHYLADKLIKEMRYRKKPNTSAMKGVHRKLVQFHREVLGFGSASEVLQKSPLFR